MPELLCPAGSREAALAALCNGADALYLGASAFGARAFAGFDEKALEEIIALSHFWGKRVYVTVNTLVKEQELDAVRETLKMLVRLRADAVLVQDMGVLQLIRTEFPSLCVHASTQMALHNASGAMLLHRLGAQRVVLARECTLEEIRAVAATGIETEVFVHGAQCVSVSGQCRFSGLIGGRSGNRGRCAQPCRLPYTWQGETKAFLSPKDLCLRDELQRLTEAGVASFKIEGRLKRPEYVAVVTRIYRQALDQKPFAPASPAEMAALSQVFSRTYFPGYAGGAQDAAVINPQRASSAGVPLGTVTRVWQKAVPLCAVQLTRPLHDGDGLQVRGRREQDVIYSGADVPAGGVATLRLHEGAQLGDCVVRIDDEQQLSAARKTYEDKNAWPRVLFDAEMTLCPGQAAILRVRDDRAAAQVTGEVVQAAQSAPLTVERVRRALEKTGETLYTLRDVRLNGENAYLSAAALNDMRRRALEALRRARLDAHLLPPAGQSIPVPARKTRAEKPRLFVQLTNPALALPLRRAGADEILLVGQTGGDRVMLPVQLSDGELARYRALDAPLCAGSVGQLDGERQMLLGEGVPVWNHAAAQLLRDLGGVWQVLPRELSQREIDEVRLSAPDVNFILPVYGRARLMYLNHCPVRAKLGLHRDRAQCRLCEAGRGCLGEALTDRRGEQFPLLPLRTERGCLVQVLSCQVRSLNDRADPTLSWLLDFTLESEAQAVAVVRAYRARLDGQDAPLIPGSLERFDRGVE